MVPLDYNNILLFPERSVNSTSLRSYIFKRIYLDRTSMLRQGKFNFHSGVIKWSFKKKERKQTDKEDEYCTRCKSNFRQLWIILSDFNISKNSKKRKLQAFLRFSKITPTIGQHRAKLWKSWKGPLERKTDSIRGLATWG